MDDQIVPDDKDWTWVLERTCPECGFDVANLDVAGVGDLLRSNARRWSVLLRRDPDELRVRPSPDRWSTLEYAAHVRDVNRLYLERLSLMRAEDDPLYPNWDQDETAAAERYRAQDPREVSADLVAAADELADAFDGLAADEWSRRGRRSDGASFTIETFARYLIHDPVHHLWDVEAATTG